MPSTQPPFTILPADLRRDIDRAGFYPALVADVVAESVADETVVSHLVHQETTFERDEILRHVTVLTMTPTRLVVSHVDDHQGDSPVTRMPRTPQPGADAVVTATSESVPLSAVRGVMLTHVVPGATGYVPGSLGREVTVTLGWGTLSRVDLLPATCGDPDCDADHGFDGTITADDISLRISADADGREAVEQARRFARTLSLATGGR